MQNKLVILALLGLSVNASESAQVQNNDHKPAGNDHPKMLTQTSNTSKSNQGQKEGKKESKKEGKKEGLSSEQKEAIKANIKEGFSGLTPTMGLTPGLAAADQKVSEDSALFGLINNSAAIHEDIRRTARKMDIEPPSMEQIKKNMYVPPAEDMEKDTKGIDDLMKDAKNLGGDSGKQDDSAKMTDGDAMCYQTRYNDLKDYTPRDHFKKIGQAQGRLHTCARRLSDYEAETYLHSFPELQAKFGDGASAIKQARQHFRTLGFGQAHFNEVMKDTTKTAWKCGDGAKQSCKCHGTLWYGATKRPDDKKPIETWDQLRQWKTLKKESEEWQSCTDTNFGGDPWPDQEKQCWCENKPAYKPWKCAEEGEECLCDNGFVIYGAKVGADKKELDFFGTIKLSMAINGTHGKRTLQCDASSFDGADPAPDADKACFCDQKKKYFDSSFVKATRAFWQSAQTESQSEGELKRTAEHASEVSKVTKEKEASAKESTTSATVENEKAIADIQAAKTCAIQSIEEAYKFRKAKIQQEKVACSKTITKKRTLVNTMQFQLNVKKASAEQTCTNANKKGVADQARLSNECKRMTEEANELATQIQVEIEKINTEEQGCKKEIAKKEDSLEAKRTKETIAVEQKAQEDTNEINEQNVEKLLDLAEEKETLLQQQEELIKIQQKQSRSIEGSIKEQQHAINILIKNLRKKLVTLARKEQVLVSELSEDAPERETVSNRIIARSKETITKLDTVMATLKTKKAKALTEQTTLKEDIKTLGEKLVTLQAKIVSHQENLKLKVAERTSKKEILSGYSLKENTKTPTNEGAIVTQGAIDKLTEEIDKIRKDLKKEIQQKNEMFSTKVTTQKQHDLITNQQKIIEEQVKNLKEFVGEIENTIKIVEGKIKEEIATKKVIETQKEAFRATQKLTDAEEQLNSARVVGEKHKEELTARAKKCKQEVEIEAAQVKKVQEQLKNVKKTAADTKGKEDKARLDTEAEGLQKAVDTATKDLDDSTAICKELDAKLAEIVDKTAEKVKKLTSKIEDQKKAVETAEKEAKATIVTLPGGKEEVEKVEKKQEEETKKESEATKISPTSITVTGGKNGKTSTGKPIAPPVPAPKPKEEKKEKEGEKPKPVPVPATSETIIKKKKYEEGEEEEDDDDEPAEVSVTEVPGGEAQIQKEVTENTLQAHNARVELVKTKEKKKYELETIKDQIAKYTEQIKKHEETMKKNEETLKTEQGKLESMKTSAVTAKLKGQDRTKIEVEISAQVTKINQVEEEIAKDEATLIKWKEEMKELTERRKEIKFEVEIKVLEAKEAEAAVLESIKTVTDVELLNRKRWLASKMVGDYKKCNKYMEEFKMIFEKQAQVIAAELADHSRRLDVAQGAITALKEKKEQLADAKKTKDLEIQLDKIESEIERHTKVTKVEDKVIAAVKEKKEKNLKEFEDHQDKCTKLKSEAKISTAAVNDASTTLKNQREYQVQITNLKNALVESHEQALSKRQEANRLLSNHTNSVSRYEQQLTIANEQIADSKTKIAGAQEIQRIVSVRLKEITTLLSRPSISAGEKSKLQKEEDEVKQKIEAQQNIIDNETKNLVSQETNVATLKTTIKQFKRYVTETKEIIKTLETKVKETKEALKAPKKKDDEAPPVKGKDSEDKDAEEKDEDGDDKIDEVDEAGSEEPEQVKGGNEKVDSELDQAEEEDKSTTTQIESLTKTITTVAEKSEIADKETIQEISDTTKEEAELAAVKAQKHRLEKVRERKRCARLFPSVFSSFEIKQELKQENMCPCPNSGKGLTVLLLENLKDSGEYDKFVLSLFEKNMVVEGSFQAQVNRYFYGADDKVINQEEENVTMRLVCTDDKIDEVMQLLDAQNLSMKSTDFKISPLLKGKLEYQKWQQNSLAAPKASNHVHLDKTEEVEEEIVEEEVVANDEK